MNTKHRASFQGPITTVCHTLNMVQKPKRGEKKAISEKKKATVGKTVQINQSLVLESIKSWEQKARQPGIYDGSQK